MAVADAPAKLGRKDFVSDQDVPSYWINKPGSPKAKVNEKPQGETIDYDLLVKRWQQN